MYFQADKYRNLAVIIPTNLNIYIATLQTFCDRNSLGMFKKMFYSFIHFHSVSTLSWLEFQWIQRLYQEYQTKGEMHLGWGNFIDSHLVAV